MVWKVPLPGGTSLKSNITNIKKILNLSLCKLIYVPGRTINSFFLPDNNTGGPSTGQAYIQLQLGIETQLVVAGLQI